MELVSLPEYTEEIPLPQFEPEQYRWLVQRAAAQLQWFVVAVNGDTIVCQTPGNDLSAGEIVTVTVEKKKAHLHIRPANEYYWAYQPRSINAGLFKTAIEAAVDEYHKANRNLHPMHREKYGALVPSKSYIVTPVIVYANVLVFLAMLLAGISPLNPTTQSLFAWGGNFRPAVLAGEWWRLVSYMFLHGGGLHLLGNTFALLYIGMFLEPLLGKFRFASAYLLTGVCAGLASLMMHEFTVSVGASGAIFGMYGVFLSVLTTSHIQKVMRTTMLRSILFFVVFNLMMGLQGNTDNAAHIGGLVSGFIIGYVYFPGVARRNGLGRQALTTAVIIAVIVLILVTFYLKFSGVN